MCQLLERVLADIETEAVLASKELLEKKPLFEEAEALQRTLVAHGCSHARPDWLRSCGAVFVDRSLDGSMRAALKSAGLEIESEDHERHMGDVYGFSHLKLKGYNARLWIMEPPTRWMIEPTAEARS